MAEVIFCGAELEAGMTRGLRDVALVGASVLQNVIPAEEMEAFARDPFIIQRWPYSDKIPNSLSAAVIATLLPTIDQVNNVLGEAFPETFIKHEFGLRLRTIEVNTWHTDGSRDGDASGVRLLYPISGKTAHFSWRPIEGKPEVTLPYGVGDASIIAESPGNGLNFILDGEKRLRHHPSHCVNSVGDRVILTHDVFSNRPLDLDHLQAAFPKNS